VKKDHLEILLEDIRGKFDLVLEGHVVLERKIDGVRTELKQDISLCNFKIDALNDKIDGVRTELKQDISRCNFKIDALNDKIDDVDQRLTAKIDEVDRRLGAKIDEVDRRLGDKIDAVAADLRAHREDTEAHRGIYQVKE
jgi:chaperonin cofactor prefoldin